MSEVVETKVRKQMPRITIARVDGKLIATFPDGRVVEGDGKAVYKLYNTVLEMKKSENLRARIIIDESTKKVKGTTPEAVVA